MPMTKTEAKNLLELKKDYTPKGRMLDLDEFKNLEFRRTTEDEVYQCCEQTGKDVQSGPYFCGEIAEFVVFVDGGMIALCGKRGHTPPTKR